MRGSAIGTKLWVFCLSWCAFNPPPIPDPLAGGAFACQLPLNLVGGPPLLALHTSFHNNPLEIRLLGNHRPYPS